MDKNTLHILIDKLNNNSISVDEKETLMNYYNSFQFSSEWDKQLMGDREKVGRRLFEKINISDPNVSSKRIISLRRRMYRIAAACIILVALSFGVYTILFNSPTYIVVESGKMTKEVTLPDGTKVTMNINSTLSYPKKFLYDRRDVEFEGEGFFEVKADSLHPFVVSTPQVKVRVLGTAFNLRSYEDDPVVEASLIHGKVEVLSKDESYTYSTLKPYEKFVMEKEDIELSKPESSKAKIEVLPIQFIDTDNTAPVDVAWKEGKFAFASTTFKDLSREMKRRYGTEIIFLNKEVAAYKYTASFEQESVTEILEALRMVKPFSYKKEGERIVIY